MKAARAVVARASLAAALTACGNGGGGGDGSADAAASRVDSDASGSAADMGPSAIGDGAGGAVGDGNPFDVDLDGPGCHNGQLTLRQGTPPTWASAACADCINGCVSTCHSMCQSYYQCYCRCALTDPTCENNCTIATAGLCRDCALSSGLPYSCEVNCESLCCVPSGLSCGLQTRCCNGACDGGTCN